MKTFYHCLIMWIPFGLLFSFAAFGLDVVEGNKIITSGYALIYLFVAASFTFILYPISFLPLTFVVSKFVESLLFRVVIFTCLSGVIGVVAFEKIYDFLFMEKYNFSIITSIIIFGITGTLYALVENSFKRNIKFV
ncbi:hypothetical protein [Lysinibacillus sp. NPDC056232]|uniref:hypothetical protein n=1 Tax=Lysinibacillus sp. NPDC056232 TaxID=3345756 RepID=UPI0035DFD316